MRIEIHAKVDKSQQRPLSIPVSESAKETLTIDRLTRTDKLLNRTYAKQDALYTAGNYNKKLLDYWQCHDSRCRNQNGWCFIDYKGKHFDMDHTQQSRWAKAIANSESNILIYRPPTELYYWWTGRQGAVDSRSRRSLLR